MRKILTSVFALGIALSLGACTPGGNGSSTPAPVDPDDKVLVDEESSAWAVHGQFLLADGETVNGWNGKSNELYEASSMTAISKNQLKAISEEVYNALEGKSVKYLYKYEGAVLGVNDAGWTTNFKAGEDLYRANGSYVFKAVKLAFDAEEEVWSETQWIHDPHTAHAEVLGEGIFMPVWQETPDEDGFSWASNLAVTAGAGVYTLIACEFDAAASAESCNFGLAVVKTAEREGQAYEKIETFIPEDHTYGLVGSFNGWGGDDPEHPTDVAMERASGLLIWTGEVELEADKEVKVRADHDWTYSWGYAEVDQASSVLCLENSSGNIKVTEAGTFRFEIEFSVETVKIVVTKAA